MLLLPPEILEEILLYLHPLDKVECMLVSRRWKEILERFALYHTIIITSSRSLQKVIKKVQDERSIANKVERVVLCLHYNSSYFDELLLVLPNLKYLFMNDPSTIQIHIPSDDTNGYPWVRSIKEIVDFSSVEHLSNVLLANKCPHLTTFVDEIWDMDTTFFKNAPALTTLTLPEFDLTLANIELLHDHFPLLVALQIKDGKLFPLDFNEVSIKPATALTKFSLDSIFSISDTIENRCQSLKYISIKYPNMSAFSYGRGEFLRPTLTEMIEVNESGWVPLFDHLRIKLRSLTIESPYFDSSDFFQLMDQHGVQLNYLKYIAISVSSLASLVQAEQASYLGVLELDFFYANRYMKNFYWLKEFSGLKRLKLKGSVLKIKMMDLVENIPSQLKELSLEEIKIANHQCYSVLLQVKSLCIKNMKLPNDLDLTVSQCFPNLSKMEVVNCSVFNNTLNMGESNLAEFRFMDNSKKVMQVATLCQGEHVWYTLSPGDLARARIPLPKSVETFTPYLHYKRHSGNVMNLEPTITLVCKSVKSVIFTNL